MHNSLVASLRNRCRRDDRMNVDPRARPEVLDAPEQGPLRRSPASLSFADPVDRLLPPQQKDAVLQLYAFTDGSKLARTHTRASWSCGGGKVTTTQPSWSSRSCS